jgi:NADP-dependent 3-hydroxy acid dehydrogenase YdfG
MARPPPRSSRPRRRRIRGPIEIAPHDIADVIAFAVSRPQRVTLNEILVRPTVQAM